MSRTAVALVLAVLSGCHLRARGPAPLPPLDADGELRVYLEPFPSEAARLRLWLSGVAAVRQDGTTVPLSLVLPDVAGKATTSQRLLAHGRIPPGAYAGLALGVQRAALEGDHGLTDLLPPEEPVRVDVRFDVERGRAVVARVSARGGTAPAQDFRLAGAFAAVALVPESRPTQLAGYCSTPALSSVTVFDRRTHEVTGVIPTGRQPLGVAVDPLAQRLYVALAAEDAVQVLDLATGDPLRRVQLRAGDEPRDVALVPDGSVLVVVNPGTNTLAFVDTASASVVASVPVAEDPETLLLDRSGRRAYVLSRRSRTLTAVDLGLRTVVATVTTDPQPLALQLNRDGTQLYVVAGGSAFLTVLSVPDLTVVRTVFVGLGAAALKVDPRTDLVFVGRFDDGRIQVFDPISTMPVQSIDLPGPISYLALDPAESALVAVLPTLGQIAFVDVATRRTTAVLEAGGEPFRVTLVGERF